jgi:hypothetical protein
MKKDQKNEPIFKEPELKCINGSKDIIKIRYTDKENGNKLSESNSFLSANWNLVLEDDVSKTDSKQEDFKKDRYLFEFVFRADDFPDVED